MRNLSVSWRRTLFNGCILLRSVWYDPVFDCRYFMFHHNYQFSINIVSEYSILVCNLSLTSHFSLYHYQYQKDVFLGWHDSCSVVLIQKKICCNKRVHSFTIYSFAFPVYDIELKHYVIQKLLWNPHCFVIQTLLCYPDIAL